MCISVRTNFISIAKVWTVEPDVHVGFDRVHDVCIAPVAAYPITGGVLRNYSSLGLEPIFRGRGFEAGNTYRYLKLPPERIPDRTDSPISSSWIAPSFKHQPSSQLRSTQSDLLQKPHHIQRSSSQGPTRSYTMAAPDSPQMNSRSGVKHVETYGI